MGEWGEDFLDVADRQDIFKVVQKDQEKHVLFGILFFVRRREKIVFRIVIDHRFGEDLVFLRPLAGFQMGVHECRDLIHIEVDVRDVLRVYVIDFPQFIDDVHNTFFVILFHDSFQ